jgi:hypothetical protein
MSELSTNEARKLMEVYKSMCAPQQENLSEEVEQIDEKMDVFSAIKNTPSPIFTGQKPAQQPRRGMGGAFDKLVSNTKTTQAAATKFFTKGLKPAAAKPAPAKPVAAARPAAPAKPVAAARPAAPAKPATAAAKPVAAPKPAIGSLGGVKFERRTPTSAELKAAQAAREAAKQAGKSKSEQELSALKSAVEVSKVKKEEYDAYDLVLEYLLSQGHVETVEEALYVMMEMDAEVIQGIVSEQSNTLITPEQRRADELKYGM